MGLHNYFCGSLLSFLSAFLSFLFCPLLSFKLSVVHMPFFLLLPSLLLFFHSYIICVSLGTYYRISIYSLLLGFKLIYVLNNNISLLHLTLFFPPINSCGLVCGTIWFVNFKGVIMVSFRHFPKLFHAILIIFNKILGIWCLLDRASLW